MTLYGSVARVKEHLQPTVDTDWSDDKEAHLLDIQASVSAAIERELGRTFGAPVADTTQTFWAGADSVLLFDRPARAITSVTVGGVVNGITITGGTAYDTTFWTPYPYDPVAGTILGLRLLSGGWWGGNDGIGRPLVPVVVVGDFADTDDDGDIPDEITDVANFLIAETFKYRGASPAGFTGPDGTVVPIRDPWKDPLVVKVLGIYRVDVRRFAV